MEDRGGEGLPFEERLIKFLVWFKSRASFFGQDQVFKPRLCGGLLF
jgi:hypothetical protein